MDFYDINIVLILTDKKKTTNKRYKHFGVKEINLV